MLTALRFSFQDLLHDRSRTLLSATGLAVIIASYFIMYALSQAFASYLDFTLVGRNLLVLQKGMYNPSDARLGPEVIQAAQELMPRMVNRISPTVFRYTRVGDHVVPLSAAELQHWQPVFQLELVKGEWPTGGREIIVSEGLAYASGWEVGSALDIFNSSFTIAGLFRVPGASFATVFMPIEDYWALFDTQRGYQGLFVQATAGVDPDTLLARLQNDPRLAEGYTVYFQDNYARRNIRLLQDLSSLMTLTSGVALLGIIFGIYNAAALGTLERSRELGILLGIGFSHRSVQGFIIIRTLLLGLLAYGLGLAVAWGYATCQQTLEPLFIFGYPFDLRITPGMAAIGLAWVLSMIFVGALLSARRQLKQQVIELVSGI